MEEKGNNKYEEWLTTIANTRLIYNTMYELEKMLDNHSIHSNGIKRCYGTQQKLRACFRDLTCEVAEMTSGTLYLNQVLRCYKITWDFYKTFLNRRAHPEKDVIEILSFTYHPYKQDGYGKKKLSIYQQIIEQDINIPILILLLLKAFPGYDSKEGDIIEWERKYEEVISTLDKFTDKRTMFSSMPVLSLARREKHKSRIMLLYHVVNILNTYESYSSVVNLYNTADSSKNSRVSLDLTGFWNTQSGKLESTEFWEFEPTADEGIYFMTFWKKTAENKLYYTRYSTCIIEDDSGKLIVYMIHPESIKNRIKGEIYKDSDHVWYECDMPRSIHPNKLDLEKRVSSSLWPHKIPLTRVENEKHIQQYEKWKERCDVQSNYPDCDYILTYNLFAITIDALYIKLDDKQFYRVPIEAHKGFENIKLGDNVGTMIMNGKSYIVFDELMLYIPATNKQLKQYGITLVEHIDYKVIRK